MRHLLGTTAILVVLLASLAACGSDADESSEADPADADEDAAADGPAESGGDLTIAIQNDLRATDNVHVRVADDRLVMGSTVYDSLFATDEEGNSVPSLATDATVSDDLMEWTFTLREGVTFHNGKEFTAQDVKDNLDVLLDPETASELAQDLEMIDQVEVVGDYEVRISLQDPDAQLTSIFTDNILMADRDGFDPEQPVGTGPYQWVENVPGDHVSFEKFEGHWRGEPPLDTVTFRVIPDPHVAVLELQDGGVDILPNYVAIDDIPELEEDADIDLYSVTGNTIYPAWTNFEKERRGEYADGQAVREGLAHLWNAQEIVPPIIGDFGEVATQPIPEWQLGHDPSIEPWPYDPERGIELLSQGGIEQGDEIFLLTNNRPYSCDHATAFGSVLEEHGYEPRIECHEPEAVFGAVQAHEWDLLFARTSGRPTAVAMYRDRYGSHLADPPDDFYTVRDEEIDSLIADMSATTDTDEYERLGQELAQVIVKDKIVILPGYMDKVWVAARSNVEGLTVSPLTWYGMLMNEMTTVTVSPE